jgi:hypothetical protein
MEYLKLIIQRVFAPTWAIVSGVTGGVALLSDAIWGDSKPVQGIAWLVIFIVTLILVGRFLFAPYQIWRDDQQKINALEGGCKDPLRVKKKRLADASSSLLTSAKAIYNEWSTSDRRAQGYLERDYRDKRRRVSSLSDSLLHQEEIFSAAQDAVNRCDILIDDAMNGQSNREAFGEANRFTRELLVLLD